MPRDQPSTPPPSDPRSAFGDAEQAVGRDRDSASGKRERLASAMAEFSAAKGYAATSVTDLVAATELTRADFEAAFRNRQDCFVAAVDSLLAEMVAAASSRYSPDKPWHAVARGGVQSLLELIARRPALAKAALLEAPVAGPLAFERYVAGKRVLSSLADLGRADAPQDVVLPSSAADLACGGIEAVITDELIAGRAAQLPELLPELLYVLYVPFMDQEQAISLSGITPAGISRPDPLPGPHLPGTKPVELPGPGPRTTLLEAMIKVSVAEGYETATVEKVIAEAGSSRDDFYAQFADKQTCFLATFDYIMDHVVFSVSAAFDTGQTAPERSRAAIAALLDWFSAEPRMAHLATVGMATAGPAAHRHYRKSVRRFLPLFAATMEHAPLADRLPPSVARMALGSLTEALFDEVHAGRSTELPNRRPELVFAVLSPYLGAESASAEMAKAQASISG